jgi:MFS family permease
VIVFSWLPQLDRRVWILSAGRLLSQLGNGFTLFYAPVFFVNSVGLSATLVGIGIGSGSLAGIIGRILGGSLSDHPRCGRRPILLWSAFISAIADVTLTIAQDFPIFLLGNLLMGFGIGLYWPATEAVVADITSKEQRNESYAIVRLADSIGLSSGVVLGGALIALTGWYRALFVIDGVSYLVFFLIVYQAIAETLTTSPGDHSPFIHGWRTALGDRILLTYVFVNILFTTYLAQVQSTLPVYFTRFVTNINGQIGFSEATLGWLFTWHIALTALCQLPVARWLKRLSLAHNLIGAALAWGIGFILIWCTGNLGSHAILWAVVALAVMAIATVAYTPASSALVVTLAPDTLRGVYLSINSLCWAMGYFLGPTIGGWVLDQPRWVVDDFWVFSALSIIPVVAILQSIHRQMQSQMQNH